MRNVDLQKHLNDGNTVWRTELKSNIRTISLRLFAIVSPYQLLFNYRRRFALSFFYFHLLCVPAGFSQRSLTSFSNFSDCTLAFRPSGLAVGIGMRSKVEVAVVVHDQPVISFYEFSDSAYPVRTGTFRSRRPLEHIESTDLNNDGITEYVALSVDGEWCSILRETATGKTEVEYPLVAPSRRFIITDLNNDRFKDIVLFGRTSAGALTLLGKANGAFKNGPVLFPDVSISDMKATDINNDGVVDLIALNWLSEELVVFMGISRLVYSEQIAVPLSNEPSELALMHSRGEASMKVAIAFPEAREVRVLTGNSLGDYRLSSKVECGRNLAGVQLTHINNDAYPDLVVRTARGIEVSCGGVSGSFAPPTIFGVSNTTAPWLLADIDDDGNKDCLLLDRQSDRLLILANSNHGTKLQWPNEYAVGSDPRDIVMEDLNGDGKQDVAVANLGSNSVSLILNWGDSRFSGQQTVSVPEKPSNLNHVTGLPSREKWLIASHASTDRVTVVSLEDDLQRHRTFTVPTGNAPSTILARNDRSGLEFVVKYSNDKDRSVAFSAFTQISPRQFVERKLRATVTTKILTMSLDEGASPGSHELLLAQHNKGSRQTTISTSVSEKGLDFGEPKPLFVYQDTSAATKFIFGAYLDADPFRDVVVVMGPPQNALGVWHGVIHPFSRDSVTWIHNVQPNSDDRIALRDVNGDGNVDMVWHDGLRRAIVASFGSPRGFGDPEIVLPLNGTSGFNLGSLQTPDKVDLVWTNPSKGTVSVLFGPFNK